MDSIHPTNDPRITHHNANLNGINYHYLLALPPSGKYHSTVFLIHGWPDLSLGWRHQIPLLLHLGYRVVCLDLMGFGGTEAPRAPPEPLALYSFKRAADDIRELARQLGSERIVLGGHDWGGAIVYRVALWYPELVSHVFAVCTPYTPPARTFVPLETIVQSRLPNFGYQIQLASEEVEERIQTKEEIKQFLNALYGGRGLNGEVGFDVTKGVIFENLVELRQTPLLSEEMLEFYAEQYARNGIHGSLSWYRTREQNFQDELQLERKTIHVPVLFIQATKDTALTPAMSEGMERWISNLSRRSVDTSHWALWEAPEQVNDIVKDWLETLDEPKSSL